MVEKKLISKPGVYRLTMEQYHGQPTIGPSISGSGLRQIALESPAHYWSESSLNPKRKEPKESAHFVLGRAAHHLILGEDDFSLQYVKRPEKLAGKDWHSSRTDCKKWLADQQKRGRTVLTPRQVEQIRSMAGSLAAQPLVQMGILNGKIEQSIIWQDAKTGVWLKIRPDAIPNDSGDFADLKTSSSFGEDLDNDVFRYGYDIGAALVKWGAKEVLKIDMTSFSFVFVSVDEPSPCEVVQLTPDDIAEAELDLRMAIDVFAACLKSGNWFGPGGSQQDARWVHKKDWVKRRREYRRAVLEREINNPLSAPAEGGEK